MSKENQTNTLHCGGYKIRVPLKALLDDSQVKALVAALQRSYDDGTAGGFDITSTGPVSVVTFYREMGDDVDVIQDNIARNALKASEPEAVVVEQLANELEEHREESPGVQEIVATMRERGAALLVEGDQAMVREELGSVLKSGSQRELSNSTEVIVEYGVNELMPGGAGHNPFDANFDTPEQAEAAGLNYLVESPEVKSVVIFELNIEDNTIIKDETILSIGRSDPMVQAAILARKAADERKLQDNDGHGRPDERLVQANHSGLGNYAEFLRSDVTTLSNEGLPLVLQMSASELEAQLSAQREVTQAPEMQIFADESGRLVQVVETSKSATVEFAPQGGGLMRQLPRAEFERRFKPATLPGYSLIAVCADWLPEGVKVPAYSNGRRWNGWAIPYFPFEAARSLLEHMPDLRYDSARDAFVKTNEDEIFCAETLVVDGKPIKTYAIGSGYWCWDAAESDAEQSATRLTHVQQGALTTLQSALTQATDCGLFDEMAAHSHPDRINAFCDDLNGFAGAGGLKASPGPRNFERMPNGGGDLDVAPRVQAAPDLAGLATPAELALIRAAVENYLDLVSSPTSADRSANGDDWADREVQACKALLQSKLQLIPSQSLEAAEGPQDFTVRFEVSITAASAEEAANLALDDLRDTSLGPWSADVVDSRGGLREVSAEQADPRDNYPTPGM